MNKIIRQNIFTSLLFIFASNISSQCFSVDIADRQFAQQRRATNHRYAGLAGAGVSIPEPVSSISLNPALIHHFHQYSETAHSISLSYERDSLFDAMILNSGTSYNINERTTISANYRFLKNSKNDDKLSNEAIISVAGTMFDQTGDAQGGVDIGFNIRYSYAKWYQKSTNPIQSFQILSDSSGIISNELISSIDTVLNCKEEEHHLLFDLGLFQDNILENLDFGITFYNLFGFHWKKRNPEQKVSTVTDTVTSPDTTIDTSTYYYSDSWLKDNGKNHKSYKRMTVGLSYHVPLLNEKLNVLVPFDLEFFGLFNKKENLKLAFHTGLETWLAKGRVGLRFGYARAPYNISGSPQSFSIKNQNIFTGGGSIRFKMFGLDLYFTEYRQEWGLSAFVSF